MADSDLQIFGLKIRGVGGEGAPPPPPYVWIRHWFTYSFASYLDPVYKSPDVQHIFPAAFLMSEKIEPTLKSTKLRPGSITAKEFTWLWI